MCIDGLRGNDVLSVAKELISGVERIVGVMVAAVGIGRLEWNPVRRIDVGVHEQCSDMCRAVRPLPLVGGPQIRRRARGAADGNIIAEARESPRTQAAVG